MLAPTHAAWADYDLAADHVSATRRYPPGMSPAVKALIEHDPDAFASRVRSFSYARAMARIDALRKDRRHA